MAGVTEADIAIPTDIAMADPINFQIPLLHNHPRIHLERLAVFLAFREGFAHTSKATRHSFQNKRPDNAKKRHTFFTYLVEKPEVSLQLHRMKRHVIFKAGDFLFMTGHLSPNSALNKLFAPFSAEQIQSREWRASVSLPALGDMIVYATDPDSISNRTRSKTGRNRKSKISPAPTDEFQLAYRMNTMRLDIEGNTSALGHGGNQGDVVDKDDDEMDMD
ncbi:hypothetical protein NHQ30_009342 [Ciborinia camelliae]|nr:hypothetical protein NHQ30_009342 [Ciborinia camelliae]